MTRPILLTGFGPFRDVVDNPSGRVARTLHGRRIAGHLVVGEELPVAYAAIEEMIPALVRRHEPILAAATGVGRGPGFAIETLAVNRVRSAEPDIRGEAPVGRPMVPGGPPSLPCRWNLEALLASVPSGRCGVVRSEDAGGYVCDAAFYLLMHCLPPGAPGGFVHLPPCRQAADDDEASAMVEAILRAALGGRAPLGAVS